RLERPLRAVSMMHVEIHDGNSFNPMVLARIFSSNGDVVEQAKAHGRVRFGMMSGRPDSTKGVYRFFCKYGIHRGTCSADGTQGGCSGSGRDDGIAIEISKARFRHST